MVKVSGRAVPEIPARWTPGIPTVILFPILLLFPLLNPRHPDALDDSLIAGSADSVDTDESSYAWQIDFRHNFEIPFAVSASWIKEDNEEEIRRTGIGTQIRLVDSFMRRRLALGIGAGIYTFYDRNPPHEIHSRIDLGGLVTLTAGYRSADRWIARFSWTRVMTGNDREGDILVLGAGYRWNE